MRPRLPIWAEAGACTGCRQLPPNEIPCQAEARRGVSRSER
jgi:hypothetical protein